MHREREREREREIAMISLFFFVVVIRPYILDVPFRRLRFALFIRKLKRNTKTMVAMKMVRCENGQNS